MLNNFLRETYRSKILSRQILEKNLPCWTVNEGSLTKVFKFEDFRCAMNFISITGEYVSEKNVNASM